MEEEDSSEEDASITKKTRPIPPGWTKKEKLNPKERRMWQCPYKQTGIDNVKLRCVVCYRRERIKEKHTHRMQPIPLRDCENAPDITRPSKKASLWDTVNRKLAYVAAKLHMSARSAASEEMHDFLDSIIELAFDFADSNPHVIHVPSQICQRIHRGKMADEIIAVANSLVEHSLGSLETCGVTLQMDAGTIFHHHFLDYVVSFPETTPFLIRCEYRDSFDQWDYADITRDVILELKHHGVSVASVVGDNLAAQQAGLRYMIEQSDDAAVNRIVICPCANHTLNLVFQAEIAENGLLQKALAVIRKFQRIMRSRSVVRQYGKMCPDFPETRWFYICEVLRWIVNEARGSDLVAWLMQCIEEGNAVGLAMGNDIFQGTDFSNGQVPEWIDKLLSVISVLEKLSDRLESRQCQLWMIVPLVESAKRDLLAMADLMDVEWIQELAVNLTLKLMARFRRTFNKNAAIAASLLSPEGRMKSESVGIPRTEKRGGWYSEEAFRPLTAEEVMTDLKKEKDALRDPDDIELKDNIARTDVEELLLIDKEGEDNDIVEAATAQSPQDDEEDACSYKDALAALRFASCEMNRDNG
jgi:hypothetical protein